MVCLAGDAGPPAGRTWRALLHAPSRCCPGAPTDGSLIAHDPEKRTWPHPPETGVKDTVSRRTARLRPRSGWRCPASRRRPAGGNRPPARPGSRSGARPSARQRHTVASRPCSSTGQRSTARTSTASLPSATARASASPCSSISTKTRSARPPTPRATRRSASATLASPASTPMPRRHNRSITAGAPGSARLTEAYSGGSRQPSMQANVRSRGELAG